MCAVCSPFKHLLLHLSRPLYFTSHTPSPSVLRNIFPTTNLFSSCQFLAPTFQENFANFHPLLFVGALDTRPDGGRVKKLSPMIIIFQFELAATCTGAGLRPRGHIFYISPRTRRLIRTCRITLILDSRTFFSFFRSFHFFLSLKWRLEFIQ